MSNLTAHRRRLDATLARHAHAEAKVRDERTALKDARQGLEDAVAAQQLLQSLAQEIQERAHKQIADVVSHCLRVVFGEAAYEFKIIFEKKRSRTEARLVFIREGQEVDPLEAAGGGAVDVASLALRLACLMLTRPQRRRLLVCDEPMKNVNGAVYQERVAMLLEQLAEDLDLQLIVVTDDDWLKIGTVIELE